MDMRSYTIAGAAALLILGGCASELAAPRETRAPGALLVSGWTAAIPLNAGPGAGLLWSDVIEQGEIGPPQVIEAPDTVAAGAPFEVATWTVGTSGCWRGDGQTVERWERTLVLRPYDSHSGSEVCTGMLLFIAHRSTVVLVEPGEWTLRVHGRRLRMGDVVWSEPITAERPIHVR
jgi:hypothetical protein